MDGKVNMATIVFLRCLQVRSLEQQNQLLEAEIEAYQNRFEKPSGLRLLYEEQLKELRRIADQMRVQRVSHMNHTLLQFPLYIFLSFVHFRCSKEQKELKSLLPARFTPH